MRYAQIIFLLLCTLTLSACGAMHTATSKRQLLVQTRLSAPIQLPRPAPEAEPSARSIYLELEQAGSANSDVDVRAGLHTLLRERGYEPVETKEAARYLAQIRVRGLLREKPAEALADWADDLSDDEIDTLLSGPLLGEERAAQRARRTASYRERNHDHGYSRARVNFGVHANVHIGGNISQRDFEKIIAVALIVVAAEVVGNAMVQDVYYAMLTDIDITDLRAPETTAQAVNAEEAAQDEISGDENRNNGVREYHTHVFSFANQANLSVERARQVLNEDLLKALAEVF